jgi:hypothetical protein
MKIQVLAILLFFSCITGNAQTKDNLVFRRDTMSNPASGKVLEGEYLETVLKNLSEVRLFKTADEHYYLRFIVTKNFYFDKVDVLEIQSGTRSYYAKETRQFKISKTKGLFLIEVFKNYIGTLKDDGITGIVFSEAQTDFTRQDASQIRAMASVFYKSIESARK